jgi:hypothetical protein
VITDSSSPTAAELRFYLGTAFDYAAIALDDGQEPDLVLRNVLEQLRIYLVAHVQGFGDEASAYRRIQERRGRETSLILTVSHLVEGLVTGNLLPRRSEVAEPEQLDRVIEDLERIVELLAFDRPNQALLTRARFLLAELLARRGEEGPRGPADPAPADRRSDSRSSARPARTLIETVDGAEFGTTMYPAEVIERIFDRGGT